VAGLALVYPGLGGDPDRGSYLTHAHAPMLTRDDVLYYAGIRHGGGDPARDPTVNPLRDSDFSGLPPTFAIAAECDPLADDVPAYVARLQAAGTPARAVVEAGLVHGYLRARASVPRAAASFARLTAAISALSKGQLPEEP
jgi:acetyl esterase